ncbi:MAG: ABC transporter ATP-binding protein [Candidatus Saccharibacteria bacterium]|nr:ABC transporter ATP-binding protein [Candidatus Saccharibacteria bacterium]
MTKKEKKKSTTLRTLHYYGQVYKKYKWYTIGVLITTPIVILVRSVFEPLILANMIEKVSNGIPADQIFNVLMPDAALLFAMYLVGNVILSELRLFWVWKMEILGMYDLGAKSFETIAAQSMQFHSNRFSGSLVSQTNRFTASFERFSDVVIWDLVPLVISVTFITIILWQRVPIFAVALLLFVIIYTLVTAITSKKVTKLSEDEASAGNKETGQLADSITNIISVKSYAKETHEKRRYANFQRSWREASFRFMNYTIKRDLVFSSANLALIAAILAFMMLGPVWGISVSTLVLIVNYSNQVLSSIWNVNHIFKNIMRSFGDAKDMTEILDMVDDVVDAPNAYDMKPKHSTVEFRHVDFRHADAKEEIFHDFNLSIAEGERIGLVGVSGSGKTTLTKLLLRFADVNGGEICVDGNNIKDVTQKSLREYIAYVPQETSLFHRSIADNIAYAKPNATREEIVRAAKLANADEFIKELPNGYETLVGERGVKLSGGQRQRIAIARAILKDAPILVLDEATSALDSESEAAIQEALKTLMKGRTSIVIAHRLSTVASLDRIIVLKDGAILEQGTHAELLTNQKGAYHKLWSRQSGAFFE